MTQPGDETAVRAGALGRRSTTHFDRVQVIGTLKAAFVQGRLTEDEFDARAAQAAASQTHADLAALIADIPAGSAAARPPTAKDARMGVLVILIAAGVLGVLLLCQLDNILAVMAAFAAAATLIVASPITVGLMFDARHGHHRDRITPAAAATRIARAAGTRSASRRPTPETMAPMATGPGPVNRPE
jgi:Domain of unknown function (DUF1707)